MYRDFILRVIYHAAAEISKQETYSGRSLFRFFVTCISSSLSLSLSLSLSRARAPLAKFHVDRYPLSRIDVHWEMIRRMHRECKTSRYCGTRQKKHILSIRCVNIFAFARMYVLCGCNVNSRKYPCTLYPWTLLPFPFLADRRTLTVMEFDIRIEAGNVLQLLYEKSE